MTRQRWQNWANGILVGVVILCGYATLLLWRLAVMEIHRKDQAIVMLRADAGQQTADLRTATAQAQTALAQAQAALTQAQADRDQARAETERLNKQLAAVQAAPPAPLAPTLAPIADPAAPATPQAEPAPTGRHLSRAQHDALVAALHGNQMPLTVAVADGDAEAAAYGNDIAQTLSDAGFDVALAQYNFKPPETGLLIANVAPLVEDVAALNAAFRKAGILFRQADPSWSNGMGATMRLEIRVGTAPR